MKTYAFASVAAATAFSFIAVAGEPGAAPAVELALAGPWAAAPDAMARRPEGPWLLRAMSARLRDGTLTTLPSPEPAPARPL
jgi:hypothetical protein